MYVEQTETNPGNERFSIQDLTLNEMELLMEGLLTLKTMKLVDPEAFKDDRRSCVEMFQKIEVELLKSRS